MRRTNLIIARAGDRSLHESWLPSEPSARNWDLHISYYGKRATNPYALSQGDTFAFHPGPKLFAIADALDQNPQWLETYDQIAFADDDLWLSSGDWSSAFDTARSLDAYLAQPSLDVRSFFNHGVTLQRPRLAYREVNFIEIMCPILSRRAVLSFKELLRATKSGWGVDDLWSATAFDDGERLVVIDTMSLLHTRRIGTTGSYDKERAVVERDELLHRYGKVQREGYAIKGMLVRGEEVTDRQRLNALPAITLVYRVLRKARGTNVIKP